MNKYYRCALKETVKNILNLTIYWKFLMSLELEKVHVFWYKLVMIMVASIEWSYMMNMQLPILLLHDFLFLFFLSILTWLYLH